MSTDTEQVTISRAAYDHLRVQISMLKDDLHHALEENNKLKAAAKAQEPQFLSSKNGDGNEMADALESCIELIETICPIEGDTIRSARTALANHRRKQEEAER